MITGRFGDTTGRPYLGGRLLLPRIRASANLSFLIDTGADLSTLMPADAIKMGIDHKKLIEPTVVGGMGGDAVCFQETAVLVFNEPNRNLIRYYLIKIIITELKPDLMRMPSIIGRDILDRWRMSYDPSRNSVTFTVRSADFTV